MKPQPIELHRIQSSDSFRFFRAGRIFQAPVAHPTNVTIQGENRVLHGHLRTYVVLKPSGTKSLCLVLRPKKSPPRAGQVVVYTGDYTFGVSREKGQVYDALKAETEKDDAPQPQVWRLSFRRLLEFQHHEPLISLGCIEDGHLGAFIRISNLKTSGPLMLKHSMENKLEDGVRDLLENSFEDVAKGQFSWLAELHALGHSQTDLSQVLLEKMRDSPWIFFEALELSNTTVQSGHHIPGCAHEGASGFGILARYVPEASRFSTPSYDRFRDSLSFTRVPPSAISVVSSHPAQQKKDVPKFSTKPIAWKAFRTLHKTVSPKRTPRKAYVYETPKTGMPERIAALLSHIPAPRNGNVMSQFVAAQCGIGGVAPTSRDEQCWIGNVSFDRPNERASVSYLLEGNSEYSSPAPSFSLSTSRIRKALQSFCDTVGHLQEAQLCCNSFTVIAQLVDDDHDQDHEESHVADLAKGHVELNRLDFELAAVLLEAVRKLEGTESDVDGLLKDCTNASLRILRQICGATSIDQSPIPKWFNKGQDQNKALHICSLAVQALCVGLLSYSNAHAGALQVLFLDMPLKEIRMRGCMSDLNVPMIKLQLQRLSCMDGIVRDEVLVFKATDFSASFDPESGLDLIGSPEDILDTWGPGYTIFNESDTNRGGDWYKKPCAIRVGGGTIMATEDAQGRAVFHWFASTSIPHPPLINFRSDVKLRIGAAIKVNTTCEASESKRWKCSEKLLGTLGTYSSHWRKKEKQGGFSAGQYLNLNYTQVYSKIPGRTLKEVQMSHPDWPTYPFLQAFWGLEVSYCTGLARRVRLRELLAETIPAFMRTQLWRPPQWKKLEKQGFIDALQDSDLDLQEWFDDKPEELQMAARDIIRVVLSNLQCTGVNGRSEFIISWIIPGKQFRRFTVPCRDQNAWVKLLTDSENCATFAYVTAKCLETDHRKCRKSTAWQGQVWMLGTAVSFQGAPKHDQEMHGDDAPPELANGEIYSIGTTALHLRARVERKHPTKVAKLDVFSGSEPRDIWYRMRGRFDKERQLRERQEDDIPAQDVLVFSGEAFQA